MPVLWLIAATNTSAEILACEEAGITVTLPKPMTSNSKAAGRATKVELIINNISKPLALRWPRR